MACDEWTKLIPRAERISRQSGCDDDAAWGRASEEWPEFSRARQLVNYFIVYRTGTGNVEKRFRRFREVRCRQRAKLIDVTVEDCLLVEQAPPSKMLRQ